jgi:CRP-like cAMP-binding protein
MLDESQVVSLLSATELFSALEPEHIVPIARACKVVRFEAQSPIVRQGDPGSELFIVGEGQVAVVLEDRQAGFEQAVLKLGVGQSFGEISLLIESKRSATVKAVEDTVCIALAKRSFDSLLRQIPELGLQISRYLADRLHQQCQLTGFRFVSGEELVYDPELHKLFSAGTLEDARAIPVELSNGTLTVALTRPNSYKLLKLLREEVPGLSLEPVACAWEDYESFRKRYRPVRGRSSAVLSHARDEALKLGNGKEIPAPLNALFKEMLQRDLEQVAVEIKGHDGFAYDVNSPAEPMLKIEHAETLGRQLDSAFFLGGKKLYITDGVLLVGEARLKVELSRLETLSGLRYSVKLLDPEEELPSLQTLIPVERLREKLIEVLWEDSGLVLFSGAPRCGKTTTAYSLLSELARRRDFGNVIVLEKEPALEMESVSQVKKPDEWRPLLEAAFAQAPALLFMDDVAVPEIPDFLRLCEPGRRVLFTSNTDQPLECLQERGKDIDLNRLDGVLHQRWLPRQCPSCREEYQPSPSVLRNLIQAGLAQEGQLHFAATGCNHCRGSGYSGRCHIFELLTFNAFIREMLEAGRPVQAIRSFAIENELLLPAQLTVRFQLRQGDLSAIDALKHFGGRR